MAGGELFSDAFTVSPLLAFRLVFRRNLELTRFPLSCAFGTRCARQPRVHAFIAAAYSPTYESGDKVTLRNCFPQANEGELSLAREPRLSPSPSYPPFRLLHPTRPRLVPAIPRFLLVAASFPRSIPFGFTSRDVDQRKKKSRGFTRSRCEKEFYAIVTLSREK